MLVYAEATLHIEGAMFVNMFIHPNVRSVYWGRGRHGWGRSAGFCIRGVE